MKFWKGFRKMSWAEEQFKRNPRTLRTSCNMGVTTSRSNIAKKMCTADT